MTKEVVEALDSSKVSTNAACKIMAATVQSLGLNVEDTNINRRTIQTMRNEISASSARHIKENFQPDPVLTVHWDGNIVNTLEGNSSVDRQAIVITGQNTNQLLGVPKVEKATGKNIAQAVADASEEWGVTEKIKAMSFDTTSANTGCKKGAAVELEGLFKRELLWLPCRHHIFEIILEATFHTVMGPSTSPEIKIFKDFQKSWPTINQTEYNTIFDCSEELISTQTRESLISFAQGYINVGQPRDDYLELLELSIIFLGGKPLRGVKFSSPGPMHSARWMAKAIYSLKIWLFRRQVHNMSQSDISSLLQINLFVVQVYIMAWYSSTDAVSAPRNDLEMIRKLVAYESVNPVIASAALDKFKSHLWYLSEVSVGLALFDTKLPDDERKNIVEAIKSRTSFDASRKKTVDEGSVRNLADSQLADFATTRTERFFQILGLDTDFLRSDITEWSTIPSYLAAEKTVASLTVVNDHAERAVKLLQDYNKILTKNEGRLQNILVTVEDHRRSLPNVNKKTLNQKYKSKE